MSLYTFTQRFLRTGFRLFFKKVHISGMGHIPQSGPVLLVSNHPNSFMDALVIGSYLERPLNFLARGDAFNNPVLRKVFQAYNMLPVYRISEGKENIGKNFDTFDACYKAVENNQMILIFGEGLCKNNYELRPMKKGPARIAQRAWSGNGPASQLVIVPVGLTYQHFEGPGKSVMINYGEPIRSTDLKELADAPDFIQQFNAKLSSAIEKLAYVNPGLMPGSDAHRQLMRSWHQAEEKKEPVLSAIKKPGNHPGTLPGMSAIHTTVISLPHFWLSRLVAGKLTRGSVFYDSILFGIYWFLLPVYLLAMMFLVLYFI